MHCIAGTPGDLFINGDVNCDGTPRGMQGGVVEVDGERLFVVLQAGGREARYADAPLALGHQFGLCLCQCLGL